MKYSKLVDQKLGWLPDVSRADMAFGTMDGLPEQAPSIAFDVANSHGFADFPQRAMFNGLQAAFFLLEDPDTGNDVLLKNDESQRLFDWLQACLTSFAPKHEHKIGGLGLRLQESFKGIAYFSSSDTTWHIAGEVSRDELPEITDVRRRLAGADS